MRRIFFLLSSLALAGCEDSAEQAVRQTMRDPDAAQFRNVAICPNDLSLTTGEANGKNGFGAYTGFAPFFYVDQRVVTGADPEFMDLLNRCYGKLPD